MKKIKSPSIEEVRKDKDILTKKIADLLYEFECKYGQNMIQSIHWNRLNLGTGHIIQLQVDVKI